MTLESLKWKKVALLGLGVNNQGLAEYFDKHGIEYSIFQDWQRPEELTEKLQRFEVLFRSPGLPFLSEAIQAARERGVIVYSQTKLFFDLCPAKIIGITGTKGKGTTATLLSKILAASGKTAYLAGNIGQDPFAFFDELTAESWVILELSSFQLQDLRISPHIAVVLQITPDHLDHHQTLAEYVTAKQQIVFHQSAQDFAVINYDTEVSRSFGKLTPAKIIWNSLAQEVSPGSFVRGEELMINWDGENHVIMKANDVNLRGRFNLANVTAAIAAAYAAGCRDRKKIKAAVSSFTGLPHRLELVAEKKGVKFYNDSLATAPETTIAALSAFEEPIVLIAGGSEKNADYASLGTALATAKIKALLPIGRTGPKIAAAARKNGFRGKILDYQFTSMPDIVREAFRAAAAGDVVLLSPASASFDMFRDAKDRGDQFREETKKLSS